VVWGKFSKLERLSPMVSGLGGSRPKIDNGTFPPAGGSRQENDGGGTVRLNRLAVPNNKMTAVQLRTH
jgi:hypothetical protein